MKPTIIYCYDAYCGWCYGFSPIMRSVATLYANRLQFEVLSGGMILPESPQPISTTAEYIKGAYKEVETLTGIKFGEDYLWHIFNAGESDWFPNSEKPAVAMCIFKEIYPDQQVSFAADLQYALHYEGRDLCDNEAYRHLLEKYAIPAVPFYEKLASEEYKEKARYEFALCRQLQVTGYPTVLLQVSESKFFLLARGFTDESTLVQRIEAALADLNRN